MAQQITNPEETLTRYRKAADEALRSAGRATEPDVRKAYLAIRSTWTYLADELEREMEIADHETSSHEPSDDAFMPPPAENGAHRSH